MYEVEHPKPVFFDNLEGWGGEGEGGFRREGTHVYLCSINVSV